jgi:hypothetical protein
MKFKHTYRRAADCVSAPEELTNAVLQIPKQTKQRGISRPLRLVAVAAVLALMIGAISFWPAGDKEYVTGPGVLAIRAYALNEQQISDINSTVLEEGVELPWEYVYHEVTNVVKGLPIKLDISADEYSGMEITFDVSVTAGRFERYPNHYYDKEKGELVWDRDTNMGNKFTIQNNTTIFWVPREIGTSKAVRGSSYVDILIRADNIIVGYAVVEIYECFPEDGREWNESDVYGYLARVIEIVSFPDIEGEYQSVVRGYVERKFEEIHQEAK